MIRVLLIRAVNVGGATMPMGELRAVLSELGAAEPRTYLASGNAVADVPGDPAAFDRALADAIEGRFGFRRDVVSRTPHEVADALVAHPFEVLDPKYSYVSFLVGAPSPDGIAAAGDVPTGEDRWQVAGRELHLRFAVGMGHATLDTDRLHRRLGVAGTARNLRTVRALVDLAGHA
ncbi:DUF1697 domain-containing protein [Isoptericola sp. b441]|uniref:DUF1697 domain-containing protein n=1 Tax=Actinotalea lenta TaxID=3064654 RepID=A0ABT9D5S5_9CELL|nr:MULTISPECIES: DUF1697 domain-containing protein [unclassified Isoptericola]MDO8106147.1 DUF1697 domain-containing protein [Isoptericola sp. b441]MDO8122134.1 DUF1697 domain-containing protein [Isoptericola sp. b490]